ncbi:hypothetical protein [Niabella beijingensis]|uniref:hypothetical protein n=1 Tax=Niabella beijingensis TaxID=2872700 RepID=UPI001CBB6CC5|nr:hypothetical protein [Niabella beijingensis]MBZ4188860.1 hypothetical protein [Niabella beijingensis]
MSKSYYVNKNAQSNGDHEVHDQNCAGLPAIENRIYLGVHDSCHTAVREAKNHYTQVNGCKYCCPSCHTQ